MKLSDMRRSSKNNQDDPEIAVAQPWELIQPTNHSIHLPSKL